MDVGLLFCIKVVAYHKIYGPAHVILVCIAHAQTPPIKANAEVSGVDEKSDRN